MKIIAIYVLSGMIICTVLWHMNFKDLSIWPYGKMEIHRQINKSTIFVCNQHLGMECPLSGKLASFLFPNDIRRIFHGQASSTNDILVVVCGCSNAYVFRGIIIYIDNGHGTLFLPGVMSKKVVYIGARLPKYSRQILVHIPMPVIGIVSPFLFNKHQFMKLLERKNQKQNKHFLGYIYNRNDRSLLDLFRNFSRNNHFDNPTPENYQALLSNYSSEEFTLKSKLNYRFTFVMDDINIEGYVSEKIVLAFLEGTIPIYCGSKDIYKIFNPMSFIYFRRENYLNALDQIKILENNEKLYMTTLNSQILLNGNNTLNNYFFVQSSRHEALHASIKDAQYKYITTPKTRSSSQKYIDFSRIKTLKENVISFYIYNNSDMMMNDIIGKCNLSAATSHFMINAFLKHPWRSYDASNLKLFIIPISAYQSRKCDNAGHLNRIDKSMKSLLKSEYFKRFGGRDHLLMAFEWEDSAWHNSPVIPAKWWNSLHEVTCTRFEYYGMSKWERSLLFDNKRKKPLSLFSVDWERTKRTIVLPYVTEENLKLETSDYEKWSKRHNFFWYHTRRGPSAHNATQLRHLPLKYSHFSQVMSDLTLIIINGYLDGQTSNSVL